MRLSPNYHATPQTKAERNRDAFRFLVLLPAVDIQVLRPEDEANVKKQDFY